MDGIEEEEELVPDDNDEEMVEYNGDSDKGNQNLNDSVLDHVGQLAAQDREMVCLFVFL